MLVPTVQVDFPYTHTHNVNVNEKYMCVYVLYLNSVHTHNPAINMVAVQARYTAGSANVRLCRVETQLSTIDPKHLPLWLREHQ